MMLVDINRLRGPRRYPDRIMPKNVEAAAKLKERAL
jgi:hypothetical protein